MRGAGCWVLLLLGFVACVSPGLVPEVPAPPLEDARVLEVFDPLAQVEGRPSAHASDPLRVLDVQPVDRSHGEPIQLRFDRPVGRPDALPEARLVVERQGRDGVWADVEGESAWTRADRLRFDPQVALPGAHRIRVRLEGVVEGIEDVSWTFESPRPQLELVEDRGTVRGADPLLLWCDETLSPAVLQEHLDVRDGQGRSLPIRVDAAPMDDDTSRSGGSMLRVRPRTRWPEGDTLQLRVDASFRTDAGVLPLGEPLQWSVETLAPFVWRGIRCADGTRGPCPRGAVTLALSNEPWTLEGIRMRPEPANFSVHQGEDGVILDGDFEARRYTVVLPPELEDYDEQRLLGPRTKTVRFTEALVPGEAELWLSSTEGVFAEARQARIGVRGDRVRTAEIRIAVLDPAAAAPYLRPREDPVPWPRDVVTHRLEVELAQGTQVLDLSRFAGRGDTVVVEARPTALAEHAEGEMTPVRGVFRISDLGIWTHSGPARGVVRVTALSTGHPIAGAQVEAVEAGGTRVLGKTSAQGLLALPGAVDLDASAVLVVRTGDDAQPLPLPDFPWNVDFRRWCKTGPDGRCRYGRGNRTPESSAEAPPRPLRLGEAGLVKIGVGRAVFRPAETLHVAGWAGISTPHRDHNTRRVPKGTRVQLTLLSGETAVSRATATVSERGRFSTSMRIPKGAALGRYALRAEMLGARDQVWFEVSEVRLPAFEVHAQPRQDAIVRGTDLRVDVHASHLSGEPTPIGQLDWVVDCARTAPALPELDEAFSAWSDARSPAQTRRGRLRGSEASSRTVSMETDALDHRSAWDCRVSVAVQDPSSQPIGAETSVRVHPGPGYVALALPERTQAGERPVFRAMVVDHEGRPRAAERLGLDLVRTEEEPPSRLKRCEADTVVAGAQLRCRAPALRPGWHRVRVWAEIDGARVELQRWVSVPEPPRKNAPTRAATSEAEPRLEIHGPDEAKPGAPIDLRITAPWGSGEGVLTVEQTGLRETKVFSLRHGRAAVTVHAAEGAGEILELTARVERPDGRPRARVESTIHQVFVQDREPLKVEVVAPTRVAPGSDTRFTVRVKDADGAPVDARLAVWVVDEAVHQLREPGALALPWRFNPHRPLEYAYTANHDTLLSAFDAAFGWRRGRPAPRVRQAKAMVKGALDLELRGRFEAAPLFVGDVGTGKDGVVTIPLALADDLTRFRIQVVASAELAEGTGPAIFGEGRATFAVSTPLPVRAALPRALRPGDTAEVAAIVRAPEAGTLTVGAQAGEARVRLVGPDERVRHVRAGQVVRVPFSVEAATVGDDAVTFTATLRPSRGEAMRGAVRRPLAVNPERTAMERAATYGSVAEDRPVAIPVLVPRAERGRVEVAVTTTALGDLQDAAAYLTEYPYGCVEQTASRLIPLVGMHGLGGRVPDARERIADAVAHLQSMQLPSGHFAYWPGSQEVSAFGTAYAAWVLQLAREAGATVPEHGLTRALEALRADVTAPLPATPGPRDRALVERVMALRAVAETGSVPAEALAGVWDHRDRLPVFSRLLLLQTLHRVDPNDARIEPLLTSLSSSIEQRAGVAHVVDPTEPRWWWMFSSQTRTEAMALMTLQQVAPEDPRIEKLVAGLRASRRGGRWRNTQENAFALLALSRYASAAEGQVPDQRVQAWIGTRRVVDATLVGFEPAPRGGAVALRRALGDRIGDRAHVVIHREGQGRTYYRVGVEWTPEDAPARAQGITIHRTVPEAIRVGEGANLEVSLTADAAVHHLAVEVPLPAGLEAVDPNLGAGARARVRGELVRSDFVSHEELRPDRVLLFFDVLPPGTTKHAIPVTATTPGRYVLPAAVAEAMYEPETRGRTEAGVVRVLPRR